MALAMTRVPSPNWSNSNTPTGPVPDHGAGTGDDACQALGGIRTDVEYQFAGRDLIHRAHVGVRRGREFRGHDHVGGQGDFRAALARPRQQLAAGVEHVLLAKRLAHR